MASRWLFVLVAFLARAGDVRCQGLDGRYRYDAQTEDDLNAWDARVGHLEMTRGWTEPEATQPGRQGGASDGEVSAYGTEHAAGLEYQGAVDDTEEWTWGGHEVTEGEYQGRGAALEDSTARFSRADAALYGNAPGLHARQSPCSSTSCNFCLTASSCTTGKVGVTCCWRASWLALPTRCSRLGGIRHCGACGTVCSGASPQCCSGVCKDVASDGSNCGVCGKRCAPGLVCSSGTCTCPGAFCDGVCKDVKTDVRHCGGCNTACAAGFVCSGGSCVCPAGRRNCGGSCKDVDFDNYNCGSCGRECEVTYNVATCCSFGRCFDC